MDKKMRAGATSGFATGRVRAAAALLGLALGDDAVPGIGDRALSSIRPGERTTPASFAKLLRKAMFDISQSGAHKPLTLCAVETIAKTYVRERTVCPAYVCHRTDVLAGKSDTATLRAKAKAVVRKISVRNDTGQSIASIVFWIR